MILPDTSCVIELLAGTKIGEKISEKLKTRVAAVSAITVNEIFVGVKDKDRSKVIDFFSDCDVFSYDFKTAQRSALIERDLDKKGKPIGKLDTFIAATALENGVPIMTLDNHFKKVKDLVVEFV